MCMCVRTMAVWGAAGGRGGVVVGCRCSGDMPSGGRFIMGERMMKIYSFDLALLQTAAVDYYTMRYYLSEMGMLPNVFS